MWGLLSHVKYLFEELLKFCEPLAGFHLELEVFLVQMMHSVVELGQDCWINQRLHQLSQDRPIVLLTHRADIVHQYWFKMVLSQILSNQWVKSVLNLYGIQLLYTPKNILNYPQSSSSILRWCSTHSRVRLMQSSYALVLTNATIFLTFVLTKYYFFFYRNKKNY